ncbi:MULTISPECIES: hypothetical protein [unclassified Streptomyces]|uniref:hypothetical protein n=1 Tax=unclassified Streptomyces TaxID=2593676 RepID=UPI0022B5F3E7|nr:MULTISPECIES: hypothetical protein [unclassified Streptomyces]MCZ7414839.1 hypothetical protein [Streptomyces sp. WMMC897]MCZ7431783.1 hypothetical protein [Streptomyces sp. WMMC1477]
MDEEDGSPEVKRAEPVRNEGRVFDPARLVEDPWIGDHVFAVGEGRTDTGSQLAVPTTLYLALALPAGLGFLVPLARRLRART